MPACAPSAPRKARNASASALNVGNASGAFFGGLVIASGLGYLAPAWLGVALTLAGLVIVATIGRRPVVGQAVPGTPAAGQDAAHPGT